MANHINGYRNNPQLQTIKAMEGWQGTPVDQKGRFLNLNHPFVPNWVDVFRWQLQKSPFRKEKKEGAWSPRIFKDASWLKSSDDVIVWLGHSTFYIRINRIQLITDPVFFDISFLKRRSEYLLIPIVLSILTISWFHTTIVIIWMRKA